MKITCTINFNEADKTDMLTALPYVINNADNDEQSYMNYVKAVTGCGAEEIRAITTIVADAIKADCDITVTKTNQAIMCCGLSLYADKLRTDGAVDANHAQHKNLANVLNMIDLISSMRV